MHNLEKMIIQQYEINGFKHIGKSSFRLKFSNMFSLHFVFLVSTTDELLQRWKNLHHDVIQEYLDFKEDAFLEWNFYTVFLIEVNDLSKEEKARLSEIEQDRSYTRKFVRSINEIEMLPPGLIRGEDLETEEEQIFDITKKWKEALGEELYKVITGGTKTDIEKRLKLNLERTS